MDEGPGIPKGPRGGGAHRAGRDSCDPATPRAGADSGAARRKDGKGPGLDRSSGEWLREPDPTDCGQAGFRARTRGRRSAHDPDGGGPGGTQEAWWSGGSKPEPLKVEPE